MAYGDSDQVTLLLGGTDTVTFTAANITAAIAMADDLVDSINSDASDTRKKQASNIIATNILLRGRQDYKLKGTATDAGNAGKSAASRVTHQLVPPEAMRLLRTIPDPVFHVATPDVNREV